MGSRGSQWKGMRMLFTGEETEKQRRPWRCANTGQQQLKCWGVISAVLLTNLKPSSMRAARKKSNSILSSPRAKRASLSAPTRSARAGATAGTVCRHLPVGFACPVAVRLPQLPSPSQAGARLRMYSQQAHADTRTHACAHVHGAPQRVDSSAGLQHPAPVCIQHPAAGGNDSPRWGKVKTSPLL